MSGVGMPYFEPREYTHHAMHGYDSVAHNFFCTNERYWRQMLNLTNEVYSEFENEHIFDECNNPWQAPIPPRTTPYILDNLLKYSDFEEEE